MHAPNFKHWLVTRGNSEYLKVTSIYGTTLQRGGGFMLVVYAGAAYAPRHTRRTLVSGGAVLCGGAAIQWISRKQKTSTVSTSEARIRCDGRGFQGGPFSTVRVASFVA